MSLFSHLPLRPVSQLRSLVLRVLSALLALLGAVVLTPVALSFFSHPSSVRPVEQVEVTAELLSAPGLLPFGTSSIDRFEEDALPLTAAPVELPSGELRVVYGLPEDSSPGPVTLYRLAEDVPIDAQSFVSLPPAVSGEGTSALSVLPFPSRELAGDPEPWRWVAGSWTMALGVWLLLFAGAALLSAVLFHVGQRPDGFELYAARRDGLVLDPDAGQLQWSRLQRLEGPWGFLPRAWVVLAALAAVLSAMALAFDAAGDSFDILRAIGIMVLAAAGGLPLVGLPAFLGPRFAAAVRSRFLLAKDPLLVPA